jgi:hypothetical protein|tara:strand:+ start:2582 stop:3505 length:924 start_codon:yes stop_codon:yes gene_type:complete
VSDKLQTLELEEETPKRGYVTLGINTSEDNIRYCYALACSIKICDPEASITLIVDKGQLGNVQSFYEHAFDYMIELPYGNSAHKDGFHGMNLWQVFYATPYEETIYVDYDTLFINVDIQTLWDTMASGTGSISVPKNAYSYRNFPALPMWRFEYENAYKLPKYWYNLIYFRKSSEVAREWFKMADPVMQNWRDVYNHVFPNKKPEYFQKNLLGNVITHFVDHTNEIGVQLNNHYDLHSQSHGAFPDPNEIPKNWTDMLNYWVTDKAKIQIENSIISSGIIHYSDETFLSDEVVDVFRTNLTQRLQER